MEREHLKLEDIGRTVEELLATKHFRRSPQLSAFLRYIVDQSLEGRGSLLKAYTIAVDAFGRPVNFDPVTDPVVRVQARRLRRALSGIYRDPDCRLPVWIELPIGRYEPSFHRNVPGRSLRGESPEQAAARYRALVQMSGAIEWRSGEDGSVRAGYGWTARTGQTEEDMTGDGWLLALHPDDRLQAARGWVLARRMQEPCEARYRVRHRDGSHRWMLFRGMPLEDADGAILEWTGTVVDVHEQVTAAEAQRTSDERLRLAMEVGAIVTWEIDIETRHVTRSKNARVVFGLGSGPAGDFLDLIHPDDAPRVVPALEAALVADVPYFQRFRIRRPDGSDLAVVARGHRRRDTNGHLRFFGVLAVASERV